MRSSMRSTARRASLVLAAVLAAGVVATAPAAAEAFVPAGAGSTVSFSGSGGEFITQDREWSFDTSNATISARIFDDGQRLEVLVSGSTWWNLEFAAPSGERLTAGVTYEDAARYMFQAPDRPGLSLWGDGRGCNTSEGAFTVLAADFTADGEVEEFEATFTHKCGKGGPDLSTGHVRLGDVVAPDPLTVHAEVTAGAVTRVPGRAVLTGTLTCSRDTEVDLAGTLAQRVSPTRRATGSWSLEGVACGPTPTTWTATVLPDGRLPFTRGLAQVDATAAAVDEVTGGTVTDVVDAQVRLTR